MMRSAGCMMLLVAACCCGCESPGWVKSLGKALGSSSEEAAQAEQRHQEEYVATRSRSAMHWLLANRIESGMAYLDVCRVMCQEGSAEPAERWVKGQGYQVGDEVYRFGPDNQGQSVYLVFREGRLVNFDPERFKTTAAEARESLP
jgi:hypothetical protein